MSFAPRQDQLQLMKVAELDACISRLERQIVEHPGHKKVEQKQQQIFALEEEIAKISAEMQEAEAEMQTWGIKIAEIKGTIAEKSGKLTKGTGMDSRMLLALQEEITGQERNLAAAEEAEFILLEKIVNLEGLTHSAEQELKTVQQQRRESGTKLADILEAIWNEKLAVAAQREALYSSLAPALQSEYQRARESGGLAVIGVHPDGTSTGGIQLSPLEVAAVRATPPDEIYLSEEYGCIVVLLDS